jgi:hypothetical protein
MAKPAAIRTSASPIFQVSGSPSSTPPSKTEKAGVRKAKTGQTRCWIAAHEPEPNQICEGHHENSLEQESANRQGRNRPENRTGYQEQRRAHHRRYGELIKQQLFGARIVQPAALDDQGGRAPEHACHQGKKIADPGIGSRRAELVRKDDEDPGKGQRNASQLRHVHPFAEQEVRADQHPERHGVDHQRTATERGIVKSYEDAEKFRPEEKTGQQAGRQRAIPVEEWNATRPAPEIDQNRAERRSGTPR